MDVKRVKRARKGFLSNLYLPSIFSGMMVTLKHMFMKKDTLQYPEQKREFGERYRGVPSLVKDQDGRAKCVACYMCQFVCPSLAINIEAGEYPTDHKLSKIEKYPEKFEINMLRCIYCGLCEEVCPEEAIFMSKVYIVTGHSRRLMRFDKDQLLEIGGVHQDEVQKWSEANKGPAARSHVDGDDLSRSTTAH